jgi:hypothetical protein
MSDTHHFYGKAISREQQEAYIQAILDEFGAVEASEELREKVYYRLMQEQHLGNVVIPFKVLLVKDESGNYPPHIDVVLDTRV